MSVVDLARRIARAHNRVLVPPELFRPGGSLTVDGVTFPMRGYRVARAEVQAWLDAALGTGPQRGTAELYGSTPRRPLEYEVPGDDV